MSYVDSQVRLYRDALSTPWGFRLQGGADFKAPLTVQRVSLIIIILYIILIWFLRVRISTNKRWALPPADRYISDILPREPKVDKVALTVQRLSVDLCIVLIMERNAF